MPPGAIGSQRLLRGGPLLGHFQPVEVRVPEGALISVAHDGGFGNLQPQLILVGLQVAPVYRFQVTSLPLHENVEIYPTVELIGRNYPPPGQELRFPIPIELTREDLELAIEGMFVTRVVYLEEPTLADSGARQPDEQPWFEAAHGADPLVVADGLGRPVAIVRIGGRVPENDAGDASFFYGCPPVKLLTANNQLPFGAGTKSPPPGGTAQRPLRATKIPTTPPATAVVSDHIPPDLAPYNGRNHPSAPDRTRDQAERGGNRPLDHMPHENGARYPRR